jgi:hypothetical protein
MSDPRLNPLDVERLEPYENAREQLKCDICHGSLDRNLCGSMMAWDVGDPDDEYNDHEVSHILVTRLEIGHKRCINSRMWTPSRRHSVCWADLYEFALKEYAPYMLANLCVTYKWPQPMLLRLIKLAHCGPYCAEPDAKRALRSWLRSGLL